MKRLTLIIVLFNSCIAIAQTDPVDAREEVLAFQKELNQEYKDRDKSPLEKKALKKFKGLPFFPIDLDYRVPAKLVVTDGTPFIGMKTTTSRLAFDRVYGYLEFELKGQAFRVPVYQSRDLMKVAEYEDYLFFPFTDLTNGRQTYAGGRYIDLRIPADGENIIVDFNKAYNPYCAYSARFSCPLVPAENQLDVEIPVGVMY
ncbi:MAG TPA: DUF1684 domain-containing protein [Chryseosolibacter sp.]|nr:DUF1684 domain-containing protein [Chryseosolibacter sp.]